MQAASNGLANAEVNVQSEYQNYSFVTVNQAQTMQLIIFIFMFFGAVGFYFWFLKPLFKLLDRVRSKLVHCSCAVPALCCIAVDQTAAKHCSDVLTEPLQLLKSLQSIWKSLHTKTRHICCWHKSSAVHWNLHIMPACTEDAQLCRIAWVHLHKTNI